MAANHVARVLIVDDEPELRQLLKDALGGADVQVRAAASGREAVDLAKAQKPDLVVTDLYLGDCTGLDVIDRVRGELGDVPAVVITGRGDARNLTEASRRRPVELMTKPLDIDRLRRTVRLELSRQIRSRRQARRTLRLRELARESNLRHKRAARQFESTCTGLSQSQQAMSSQLLDQQTMLSYQKELLAAKNDDDVFRAFFRLFVKRTGAVYGVALVCDADANLQMAGRFGVPAPDSVKFCTALAQPTIGAVLANPRVQVTDAGEEADLFDPSIRKYLIGLSVLAIPLMPADGEMIALAILYRKGEQPFLDEDVALANLIGSPTAIAIRRND